MTVLVVGHTGYVGRNLLSYMAQRGISTAGVSRTRLGPHSHDLSIREFDLDEMGEPFFHQFLKDEVDTVIILSADTRKGIAPSDVASMTTVNASLPAEIALRAADASVPRLLFASTYSIESEAGTYSPQSLYAATKKAAEDLLEFVAQTSTIAITAMRLYDIYGPGQPHNRFIPYVIRQVLAGEPISMTPGTQEICPIFIDDVSAAALHCMTDEESSSGFRRVSLFGPEVMRVRDVPNAVAGALGLPVPAVVFDREVRPREVMRFSPSHELPQGWRPTVFFGDGVRATSRALVP